MRRTTTTTLLALCLIALLAAATGFSSGTVPQQASRTAAVQDHRGGTLKLLAKAAAGTIDPQVNYTLEYWQLFQATYDGLVAFQKAGGSAAFNVVPDLASNLPTPTNGGKKWVFHLRKGIKFSNGKTVTPKDVVASFQRIYKVKGPNAGSFYAGIVGAHGLQQDPGDLHAQGRRGRERRGEHDHDQPRQARLGIQVQARRPLREHRPGGQPAEGRRHQAAAGHGRVLLRVLRPEQAARDEAEPVLQAVVAGCAACGLSGRDHPVLRLDGRSRRSPRSRTDRRTGRTRTHRPTASARWARSTRARCTSAR